MEARIYIYGSSLCTDRALHDEIKVHVLPLITLPFHTTLCKHSDGIHFLMCLLLRASAAAHVCRAAAIFGGAYAADRRTLHRDLLACFNSSQVKQGTFGDGSIHKIVQK